MPNSFSREVASQILGIKPGRLRYWDRIGLVTPSVSRRSKRSYSFQDLICLKTAQGLTHQGLRATRIKRSIDALRKRFPDVGGYWANKRIFVFGSRAVVSDRDHLIDSQSGQLLFQFEVEDLTRAVEGRLQQFSIRKTARDWFQEGLAFDGDEGTYALALHAYQQALLLDPDLTDAHVNTGNIFYQQGRFSEAEKCYRMALEREPDHAKAYFNLGNTLDELGRTEEALGCYEKALQLDHNFPDAQYNLALACEGLGRRDKAVQHWQDYLALETVGKNADFARRRIRLLRSQLLSP